MARRVNHAKALREIWPWSSHGDAEDVCNAAADYIDALKREIRRLKRKAGKGIP